MVRPLGTSSATSVLSMVTILSSAKLLPSAPSASSTVAHTPTRCGSVLPACSHQTVPGPVHRGPSAWRQWTETSSGLSAASRRSFKRHFANVGPRLLTMEARLSQALVMRQAMSSALATENLPAAQRRTLERVLLRAEATLAKVNKAEPAVEED